MNGLRLVALNFLQKLKQIKGVKMKAEEIDNILSKDKQIKGVKMKTFTDVEVQTILHEVFEGLIDSIDHRVEESKREHSNAIKYSPTSPASREARLMIQECLSERIACRRALDRLIKAFK